MDFASSYKKFLEKSLKKTHDEAPQVTVLQTTVSESSMNNQSNLVNSYGGSSNCSTNSMSSASSTSSTLSAPDSSKRSAAPLSVGYTNRLNHLLLTDFDDTRSRLNLFLHQQAGHTDDCINLVDMEHSYSRPWNWRPENNYAKPLKTLFINRCQVDRIFCDNVDVESTLDHPSPPYDCTKARLLMEECERQVSYVRPDDGNDVDWEERIDKTLWIPSELRLFNRVVRILNSDKLSRLTYKGHWNEPVMRRITVDKSARRFRQAMATVDWDTETIQWLHCLLMEHLSSSYLAAYFDILQTLKSKIPQLVDRMITVSPASLGRHGQAVNETLMKLVKRPWDPANLTFAQHRSRKLPGGPIVVMVPFCPGPGFTSNSRPHHWLNYLSTIGTLISVVPPPGTINAKTNISNCLDQLVASTRSKIAELRADYSGRAIILVGMYSGAVLACQVALVENVTAVVCLGFPLYSVDDKRGQPDDSILDLQVPVMFVVGQNASLSSVEEMEELREQMHVETGLVVVGGADDQLRISKSKKLKEGVTQSMVDRCILDEVSDFLGSILMTPHKPSRSAAAAAPTPQQQSTCTEQKHSSPVKVFDRKRKISDSKTDLDGSHRPAKRGRKPKTLTIHQKVASGDSMVSGRWATSSSSGVSTVVTSRPVVSQVTTISTSGAGSSTSGLICKNVTSPLTGLRLGAQTPLENKSSNEVKTVQLSIQGSVVRQSSSVMPSEGGITVVASAPAVQPITPTSKDIVIQVANSSKSRGLSTSGTHVTSLSSLLQPAPTIVLSPTKSLRDDSLSSHHIIPTSLNSSICDSMDPSSFAKELTPARILELPIVFEDQQPVEPPQSDLSTVKVILGNNSGMSKKQQPLKPSIPAIKYIKKSHPQGVKYTKIFLRKKDDSLESSSTSVFVEEVDENELNANRGSRLRHIPATEHSQFC